MDTCRCCVIRTCMMQSVTQCVHRPQFHACMPCIGYSCDEVPRLCLSLDTITISLKTIEESHPSIRLLHCCDSTCELSHQDIYAPLKREIRSVIPYGEGRCLSEAKKVPRTKPEVVPRIHKSTGNSQGI